MLLISENMTYDEKYIMIENEKAELHNSLMLFKSKKSTLLLCMRKITDNIDRITYIENPEILNDALTNLKDILCKMHFNEDNLQKLQNMLENISINDIDFAESVKKYNALYRNVLNEINSNSLNFEKFFQDMLENSKFAFKNQDIIAKEEQKINFAKDEIKENTNMHSENIVKEEASKLDIEQKISFIELTDNNCLLISEKENKVFLPYKISDLKEELKDKSNEYSSIQDLIEKKYILPLDNFKSPTLSRFKEAYNLMKNKENASFIEAMSLAIELSLNSTLNPAVIAACKNQDELDIYLDCLYEDELDKFKIFEIKYDVSPCIK